MAKKKKDTKKSSGKAKKKNIQKKSSKKINQKEEKEFSLKEINNEIIKKDVTTKLLNSESLAKEGKFKEAKKTYNEAIKEHKKLSKKDERLENRILQTYKIIEEKTPKTPSEKKPSKKDGSIFYSQKNYMGVPKDEKKETSQKQKETLSLTSKMILFSIGIVALVIIFLLVYIFLV